jgi:FKBP-type peptidyl-prolyl cis-trans isomerase FkpA
VVKYLSPFFALIVCLSACNVPASDNKAGAAAVSDARQAQLDDVAIQKYLKANKITAQKDSAGIYYQVIKLGSGAYPKATSAVIVNYNGKLLNGLQFDAGEHYETSLDRVIAGWKLGLQHINKGGSINLYIPSGLAYGPNANGPIPANAIMMFKIDLIDTN